MHGFGEGKGEAGANAAHGDDVDGGFVDVAREQRALAAPHVQALQHLPLVGLEVHLQPELHRHLHRCTPC